MADQIPVCDFVTRVAPEPQNDKPGLMDAFDEIVTGPVDSIHIERMSDDHYWMLITKGDQRQRVTFSTASGRGKVIARTEVE